METIEEVATSEIAGNLRSLLGCFLFRGDDVFKKVDVLSGGERSRLSLAKILLKPANFLILDEPTNHLDMQSQKVLQDALISYKGTLLIVSHNRDFLDPITNKVIEFYSDGKPMKTFIGNLSSFIEARSVDVLNKTIKPSNTKLQKNTNSRKEIRKAQGKARQKKSEAIKPFWQNELDAIESDIEKCERRKTEIEKNMNSEDFFKSNDHIEITEEYKSLLVKLEKLFSNWSTTSDQIDEISNEYDKIINEI